MDVPCLLLPPDADHYLHVGSAVTGSVPAVELAWESDALKFALQTLERFPLARVAQQHSG